MHATTTREPQPKHCSSPQSHVPVCKNVFSLKINPISEQLVSPVCKNVTIPWINIQSGLKLILLGLIRINMAPMVGTETYLNMGVFGTITSLHTANNVWFKFNMTSLYDLVFFHNCFQSFISVMVSLYLFISTRLLSSRSLVIPLFTGTPSKLMSTQHCVPVIKKILTTHSPFISHV